MTTTEVRTTPSIPQVAREDVTDPELVEILALADRVCSPKPAWYLTIAHNPEVAVAFSRYWEPLHRGGLVDHGIKELGRITIAKLLGCEFCATQRSIPAMEAGLSEDVIAVCDMPDFNHPDPRTRAAVRLARTLTLDDGREAEVFAELRQVYSLAETVELCTYFADACGAIKLAKILHIEAAI
jgi:alkylhydroperoxidase family enzyme